MIVSKSVSQQVVIILNKTTTGMINLHQSINEDQNTDKSENVRIKIYPIFLTKKKALKWNSQGKTWKEELKFFRKLKTSFLTFLFHSILVMAQKIFGEKNPVKRKSFES